MTVAENIVHRAPGSTERRVELQVDDLRDSEVVIAQYEPAEKRAGLELWGVLCGESPERIIFIDVVDKDRINVQLGTSDTYEISLRDSRGIKQLLSHEKVLLDISGLPYYVWAPLLRVAYNEKVNTRVLYAEPEEYSLHKNPASASLFDLSVKFEGLAPLPGFAQLYGPMDERKCLFVAMLGFEGNRPEKLYYQLDPPPKIIPVVGVPGFQIEYPTYTVTCNRSLLDSYGAHADIRFARASCPFESYEVLRQVRRDYPDHYIYVAPVGTKPHGLGAVLYSIVNEQDSEIMFDYPVKKEGRTKGVGMIHIYDFGEFDGY